VLFSFPLAVLEWPLLNFQNLLFLLVPLSGTGFFELLPRGPEKKLMPLYFPEIGPDFVDDSATERKMLLLFALTF
jgi:hypothetical protein